MKRLRVREKGERKCMYVRTNTSPRDQKINSYMIAVLIILKQKTREMCYCKSERPTESVYENPLKSCLLTPNKKIPARNYDIKLPRQFFLFFFLVVDDAENFQYLTPRTKLMHIFQLHNFRATESPAQTLQFFCLFFFSSK